MKIVISDSTCLIAFERIGKLEILPGLFSTVLIPPAVNSEFGQQYSWLKIETLASITLSDALKATLGQGEAEAIALAVQLNCSLITDDRQARQMAEKLGITVNGALGILIQAKRAGIVDKIKPIIEELDSKGFRMSQRIER